ncbi:protein SpAN-like [Tachypleus tridentatus]|uniref:protein SpAN-like n=1 Tax=Tachypleus tridentatus TaxID=6853 RepID=UPI003FD00B91
MEGRLILILLYMKLCGLGVRTQEITSLGRWKPIDRSMVPVEFRNPRTVTHCDVTVEKLEGWISTPNYPLEYNDFLSCSYIIHRFSSDICVVDMTIVDFDLEKTPGCRGDYLDLNVDIPGQKICGSLMSGTEKKLKFCQERGV